MCRGGRKYPIIFVGYWLPLAQKKVVHETDSEYSGHKNAQGTEVIVWLSVASFLRVLLGGRDCAQKARSQQAHQNDLSSGRVADCSRRASLGLDCLLVDLHDEFSTVKTVTRLPWHLINLRIFLLHDKTLMIVGVEVSHLSDHWESWGDQKPSQP